MQPISNLVNDESFQTMMGVSDKRPGTCEKHGDFIELHCSGEKLGFKAGWRGCQSCNDEAAKEKQDHEDRERQAQMHRDRIERTVKNSGIPKRFLGKTIDNFDAANPKAAKNVQRIREYLDVVCGSDHGGRSLILLGKVGTGKTHLGCALLAAVIRRTSRNCAYWTFAELVRDVKATFTKDSKRSEQDVYDQFAAPLLLVLDEVGMQNFTDFEQAVAYEAINARYLAEKPTVLITNQQAKDLPLCVGERVVDRLREGGGRALDFDWKSYRVGGAS